MEAVWKETRALLPAVVLPGVRFDILLGMSWIFTAGVSLDAATRMIRHGGKEYTYKQLSIPSPPTEVLSATLYANEAFTIAPLSRSKLRLAQFDQGTHGGVLLPMIPRFLRHNIDIFAPSCPKGLLPKWTLFNATAGPITIQKGQSVGTWTVSGTLLRVLTPA